MDDSAVVGEIDLSTVKTRSLSGVVTLISRSFFIQVISTVGFLLLTVFLGRPEIGLFIAVNDLVSILGYFSDIGLAASLIQKHSSVSKLDLRTTFTIQQVLVILPILAILLFHQPLAAYYHLTGPGLYLLYALLAAFFLASLKTIPSVILERQLKFQVLASVEILENLLFYFVAVILAWQGTGVLSYAWAVLIRGLAGTLLLYYLAPWPIGFAFSRSSLKTLLSFGLPYQINSLMAVVKDRFLNIFLWKLIGADGVGIIGWAQTLAQKPLRFIMDNVTKVTFPAYARLQDHPEELRRALEKTLFFITAVTFPIVAGLAVTAPWIVHLIPKYGKWEVALIPLTLFCWSSAWASLSTPLTNTLNSLGKVKTNTYLMLMWTSLTWVLVPYSASLFGYLGVAYSSSLIALTSLVPVVIVRRYIHFNLWTSFGQSAVATVIMVAIAQTGISVLAISWLALGFIIAASVVVYTLVIYFFTGPALLADAVKFLHVFHRRP